MNKNDMKVNLIFAMSKNRVIGVNNQLPWHIPGDLKRFKQITQGHAVVMGRKTFESIGRPLPKRRNIVISRNPLFAAAGVEVFPSLESALKNLSGELEVFVIGGAQIFKEALALAHRIYMTVIKRDYDGDVFFPDFSEDEYAVIEAEDRSHEDLLYTDYVLQRKS